MDQITALSGTIVDLLWGPLLLVLLLGGGTYFLVRSRFMPYRYLGHAIALIRGKYDDPNDPGYISHGKALSAALAGTIGMGNIAGVAVAIHVGGPGAIFWMWMTAILGMATKFFTCALAVMYRGEDREGDLQGGPMYVIKTALPKPLHFLAYMFAIVGMVGALPAVQTNQLVQAVRDLVVIEQGFAQAGDDLFLFNLVLGIFLAGITAIVMFGGLQRVARVTAAVVPTMSVLYISAALLAIVLNIEDVPGVISLIVTDAFTGEAVAGGSVLAVIAYGIQRGAFSNEAGIGTESLAHGAAKTREPIREGTVAMLGPVIDTLLVCTATAVMILLTDTWHSDAAGVTLTANAFGTLLGPIGSMVVFVCVVFFAITTMFTYSFYGSQCAKFMMSANRARTYQWIYISFIVVAAVVSIDLAFNLIDISFALMAFPTMISAIYLAPKVMQAARTYWAGLSAEEARK